MNFDECSSSRFRHRVRFLRTLPLLLSVAGRLVAWQLYPATQQASQQQSWNQDQDNRQGQYSEQRYEQTPPSGVPSYCAEPENADLYECASRVSDSGSRFGSRQSQYRGIPGSAELPEQGARYPAEPYTTGREGFPPSRTDVRTEPPTEFQRYVASSIGRLLPIYGASLFDHVPSTFAPIDSLPITSDYTVGPGDEIDINIWGQVEFPAAAHSRSRRRSLYSGRWPRSCGRRAVFRSSDRTKECDRTSL